MWTEQQKEEYQKEWRKNHPWYHAKKMKSRRNKKLKEKIEFIRISPFPFWFTKLMNDEEMRIASILYVENWTKEDRIYLKSIN